MEKLDHDSTKKDVNETVTESNFWIYFVSSTAIRLSRQLD